MEAADQRRQPPSARFGFACEQISDVYNAGRLDLPKEWHHANSILHLVCPRAEAPQDVSPYFRCITRGVPGSMIPTGIRDPRIAAVKVPSRRTRRDDGPTPRPCHEHLRSQRFSQLCTALPPDIPSRRLLHQAHGARRVGFSSGQGFSCSSGLTQVTLYAVIS